MAANRPFDLSPRPSRSAALAFAAALALVPNLAAAQEPAPAPKLARAERDGTPPVPDRRLPLPRQAIAPSLKVVDRTIGRERAAGSGWRVDYVLRNEAAETVTLNPVDVAARVDGWVSNSRVPGHAAPRRSSPVVQGADAATGLTAAAVVIASPEESRRCRERLTLALWSGDEPEPPRFAPTPPPHAPTLVRRTAGSPDPNTPPAISAGAPLAVVPPGGVLRVRLSLEHEHLLYGPYDPLLGRRSVELVLGSTVVRETLPLDRAGAPARGAEPWSPSPPPEMVDTRVFLSAPDSLHLESEVAGKQSCRFERPVRYGSRLKLTFWYLVPPGCDGECRVKITQAKDSPRTYRVLPDGEWEHTLTPAARWTRVERIFRAEPDATSLTVEYRILGAEWGEAWIDDIRLEPLDDGPPGP